MMSWLAVALMCVAGLHLATAAFVTMHHARRPNETEFLPFAGICFSQAVSAVGVAIITDAPDHHAALIGQQIQFLGAVMALGAFGLLAGRITDASLGIAPRVIQGWAVIATLAILCGYYFDVAPRAPRTFGFAWAPDYQEARISAVGFTLTWIIAPVALYTLRKIQQRPNMPVGPVEFWVSFVLTTVAFWNDTLVRFGPLRSIYITEIATLVMALNANGRLRRRFQATTDELVVRTAELELSTLELDQMHSQLQRRQQLAAVGEFSAVIAHEVRNPLAIIKNAIAALRRTADSTTEPELLAILDEEVTRLQRLVSDLSTYTRPIVPALASTPLEPLVQQLIARVRTANESMNRVTIQLSIEPGAEHVYGDADLIEMAVANVLANAAQASREGGTITIEARPCHNEQDHCIDLRIRDNGSGMSAEIAAKAKEPFFTTRSTGTGLGLAIVDRVMRAHNGRFDIESSHDGTCITLRFPAADTVG